MIFGVRTVLLDPVGHLVYRCDYRAEEERGIEALEDICASGSSADHVWSDEHFIVLSTLPVASLTHLGDRLIQIRHDLDAVREIVQRPGLLDARMSLRDLTVNELRHRAREHGLSGYSSLRRRDLIDALGDALVDPSDTRREPATFEDGELLCIPRGTGDFRRASDHLIESARHGDFRCTALFSVFGSVLVM